MTELASLETRLREALEAGTAAAPVPVDLAGAARARARTRRRSRILGGGVVAACAAAAVLAGVIVDDRAPAAPPAATDDAPPVTGHDDGPPSGWRAVQWGGVRIEVPTRWASGSLSDWCARGPLLGTPVVERPDAARGGPACSNPALGYGVQLLGPDESQRLDSHDVRRPRADEEGLYPDDAWVGVTCGGCEVAVRVIAPDPYVARYLLSTYEIVAPLPQG